MKTVNELFMNHVSEEDLKKIEEKYAAMGDVDPIQTEDFKKQLEFFDLADVNKDGFLDETEVYVFKNAFEAWALETHGVSMSGGEECDKLWIKLAMSLSEPTDKISKEDLIKMEYLG